MNAFDKRISIEDIQPGVVVYPVFSVNGSKASVCRSAKIISGVYPCPVVIGKLRFQWDPKNNFSSPYLNDCNVKGNESRQYNFHALFLNKEDAEEYASMINNKQLPVDLRNLHDDFVCDSMFD